MTLSNTALYGDKFMESEFGLVQSVVLQGSDYIQVGHTGGVKKKKKEN